MSDGSLSSPEVINATIAGLLTARLYLAATALMCFDYCLTFTREVQRIWTLGFSMSALLFYGVRYPAVFSTLFVILDVTQWHGISDSSCAVLIRFEMALNVILLSSASVFSALRAYALCMRNPRVLFLVLILGLVQPIISLYTFIQSYTAYIFWPIPSCGFGSAIPQVQFENLIIAARTSAVVTDLIVVIITVTKTRPLREEAVAVNFRSTIIDILLRDGALYFIVLLVANLIGLILVRNFALIQPMSTWIAILTEILTSRFLLDLHDAADPTLSARSTSTAAHHGDPGTLSTTLRFSDTRSRPRVDVDVFAGLADAALSFSTSPAAADADADAGAGAHAGEAGFDGLGLERETRAPCPGLRVGCARRSGGGGGGGGGDGGGAEAEAEAKAGADLEMGTGARAEVRAAAP